MDMADASGTLLLDVAHRSWSANRRRAAGDPVEWLPPLYESGDIAGHLLPEAAALTG